MLAALLGVLRQVYIALLQIAGGISLKARWSRYPFHHISLLAIARAGYIAEVSKLCTRPQKYQYMCSNKTG